MGGCCACDAKDGSPTHGAHLSQHLRRTCVYAAGGPAGFRVVAQYNTISGAMHRRRCQARPDRPGMTTRTAHALRGAASVPSGTALMLTGSMPPFSCQGRARARALGRPRRHCTPRSQGAQIKRTRAQKRAAPERRASACRRSRAHAAVSPDKIPTPCPGLGRNPRRHRSHAPATPVGRPSPRREARTLYARTHAR